MPTPDRCTGAALARVPASFRLLLLFSAVATAMFGKSTWRPVSPGELAETKPRIESDAPAEVMFYEVEVNDARFPEWRKVTEYIRYKIYAPDKAEDLTRITAVRATNSDDQFELRARLTLPDGTVHEFGKDAIRQRVVVKQGDSGGIGSWLSGGGARVDEQFLAVTGVVAGAVLEFQRIKGTSDPDMFEVYVMQPEGYPTRQADFTWQGGSEDDYFTRTFAFNLHEGKLTEDKKKHTVHVDSKNLGWMANEPFSGPSTDRVFTVISCTESATKYVQPRSSAPIPEPVAADRGPWAMYATVFWWLEQDRGFITKRVRATAGELTNGKTSDVAKADAIHRFVRDLYQKQLRLPFVEPSLRWQPAGLDDIMDVEKKPRVVRQDTEFVWLELALCRSAGLECHSVLLPDSESVHFNPRHVSWLFLPHLAAAIKYDGAWHFALPYHEDPLPLDMLPWQLQGQQGLLAIDHKQEFIPIPFTPVDQSVVMTTGDFSVDRNGTLTGQFKRRFTGHPALRVRAALKKQDAGEARIKAAMDELGFDTKTADLTVESVSGVEECEQPVEIVATVRWPGFATVTKDRVIVHTTVYRADTPSLFPSERRRSPVRFRYPWKEMDRLTIQLPEGYSPEAPSMPGAYPGGALNYELNIGYHRAKRVLHISRTFSSEAIYVALGDYPALKRWYDNVAKLDQHELIFTSRPAPAPVAAPAPADSAKEKS